MEKKYIKDEFTGKVYDQAVILPLVAIDPTHWKTDQQNFAAQIAELQKKIEASKAEEADFFAKFPDLQPAAPNQE